MLLLPFAFTILMAACDMCDALDTGANPHPFAISATWAPRCDQAQKRFVAGDPWPKAGEVRRDSFTRECADVVLTRAFVAAGNGLTEGELFVSALVERKRGRDVMVARQHEFIGVTVAHSYRYSFTVSPEGELVRVTGSIEAAKVTSHLVGTVLAPAVRPKTPAAQTIACEAWQRRCELISKPIGGDVALPFFIVQFDKAHPGGNLCVAVPAVAENEAAPAVRLNTDGVAAVEGARATAGSSSACLGDGSGKALAAIGRANKLSYDANGEHIELDTAGLAEAIALGQYLFENAVLQPRRIEVEARLRPLSDAMLK